MDGQAVKKPVVGETYVLEDGLNKARYRRDSGELPIYRTATVERVGRKYFYILGYRFYIDSMQQATEYCADIVLYDDEQSLLESREQRRLHDELRKMFDMWSDPLSLDALRKMYAVAAEEGAL